MSIEGNRALSDSGGVETESDVPTEERLRRAEERLARFDSLLKATLDSTTDGILVVDRAGHIISYNRRFREIWEIPSPVLEARDDEAALAHVVEQLEDPAGFLERVEALYREPTRTGYDMLLFRDGRVVERYSRPQRLGGEVVGRVWTFRDVTDQKRMQQALMSSERRYRRLFEESRHALFITTRSGDFVDVNRAMLELFDYTRPDLLQLNASELYHDPVDRARFQSAVEERGSVRNHEVQLIDRTRRVLDCVVTATARRTGDGSIVGYEGIIEDVTERKQSTEALRRSEEYYRSLIENALDTITILAADGTITYESPGVQRVLGFAPEELVGTRIFEHVHPDDLRLVREVFRRGEGKPGLTESLEVRVRHRDGGWRTLEAVGKNLLDDSTVGGVVVNARDVTQRKAAEERLVYDAFHDRLTGLPNRALFLDRLRQLVKRQSRDGSSTFAVLLVDVDRFKVVNESLGHTVGDQLLVEMGQRLEAALRPGDTVARVGGDEFAVLLDGAGGSEARQVAERVHSAMEAPYRIRSRDVFTTLSIGVAVRTPAYQRAEELLRDADIAMHRTKEEGRGGTAVFNRSMHDRAVAVLELETDLRRAIEEDELELYYQPIVSLKDGTLQGYESLIRWRHPQRGVLPPGDFLPIAEETGLIIPLGWWTMAAAARQVRRWLDEGQTGRWVAVNLSATQLSQPDLVDRLARILEETRVPPQALRLELTENVIMRKAESTSRRLCQLQELGVSLMIDDFGRGYSSLSYLHRFSADTLKIDRSFITDVGPNGENGEIVRTIVALAGELGMGVVAEGVETRDQFRVVRLLGCGSAQGFYLAEPMPPEQLDRPLRDHWELA